MHLQCTEMKKSYVADQEKCPLTRDGEESLLQTLAVPDVAQEKEVYTRDPDQGGDVMRRPG